MQFDKVFYRINCIFYKKLVKFLTQLLVITCIFFPLNSFAHLIAITPIAPFPTTVLVNSVTIATYNITNITSKLTLRVTDKSSFPLGSGLSIINSTCGIPLKPGQSCTVSLQFKAPSIPQAISSMLQEGVINSADCVQLPFIINVINQTQFTVIPTAVGGGTISPNLPQLVNNGASLTFSATPNANITAIQWFIDGVKVQTGGTSYTVNNITSNHVIEVKFLKNIAYIANEAYNSGDSSTISICPVIDNGANLQACTTHSDPTFNYPIDIILNKTNTIAYVANSNNGNPGNQTISICPINLDGSLQPCQAVNAPGTDYTGLALNAANTLLYYTNYNDAVVSSCLVNLDGSLSNCGIVVSPTLFPGPDGRLSFNSSGTLAFISLADFTSGNPNYIVSCQVTPSGLLSNCNFPGFEIPNNTGLTDVLLGVTINSTDSLIYVSEYEKQFVNSYLLVCSIDTAGTISNCNQNNGNGTYNFTIVAAINTAIQAFNNTNYVYVPNGAILPPNTFSVSICQIQSNGSIGTCQQINDPSFNSPMGISIGIAL